LKTLLSDIVVLGCLVQNFWRLLHLPLEKGVGTAVGNKRMASQNHMSHEEMWDDSLLVDSWNDALEEYKVRV
jgi:hypothetical protein